MISHRRLDARTELTPDNPAVLPPAPGDSGRGTARIETTRITAGLLVTIELGVIQSTATVTQHAVVLDTLLTDVVIGEAKANIEAKPGQPGGSPCSV